VHGLPSPIVSAFYHLASFTGNNTRTKAATATATGMEAGSEKGEAEVAARATPVKGTGAELRVLDM
jgi:hypothetical protein